MPSARGRKGPTWARSKFESALFCQYFDLVPPMAATLLSLRSTPSCRILACSSMRSIATSSRVLARVAAGATTKKYGKGKGAEPKKKKKLSPGAEMRLQAQTSKKAYDQNPYKMTLEGAVNVIRVCNIDISTTHSRNSMMMILWFIGRRSPLAFVRI